MGLVTDTLRLARPWQWYKNLIIFVPVVFSTLALDPPLLLLTFLGFLSLSFASSGNYVINDIIDRESDRKHPEKRDRPVASGAIPVYAAGVIALILFLAAFGLAWRISLPFFGLVLFFILLTQVYSLWLKHHAFVDVLAISVNFVSRAVAGVVILARPTTPWLILCPFFLALFLAVAKRAGDVKLLGKKAAQHRKVLASYTPEVTNGLLLVSTTLLVMSYALYAFLNTEHPFLLIPSIPFALYLIFYYLSLLEKDPRVVRHPERALRDPHVLIGVVLWIGVTVAAIYWPYLLRLFGW